MIAIFVSPIPINMSAFKRIEKHYKLNDNEFEQQFRDCQLPPILFTHEAHLRLAFIHIQKYGEEKAIENIRTQLKKYVVYAGEPGKYHDTVTVNSIKIMAQQMATSTFSNFKEFIQKNPALLSDFKYEMNKGYSFDVFQSQEARKQYIAPDTP